MMMAVTEYVLISNSPQTCSSSSECRTPCRTRSSLQNASNEHISLQKIANLIGKHTYNTIIYNCMLKVKHSNCGTLILCKKHHTSKKGKGSTYSIIERRVLELIPVLGSQPAGDVSHKPGGRLPLISARPAVTPATLKRAATNFAAWQTEVQWV